MLHDAGKNNGTTNPAIYDINFGAGLAYVNIDDMSINSNNLVGTGSVSPSFGSNVQGIGNEMQRISQSGSGQMNLSFGGVQAATTIAANTSASALQTYINTITSPTGFLGVPSNVTTLNGNTTVFGQNGGPYYVVFRNQLAFTDVPRFFARAQAGTTVAITSLSGTGGTIPEGPSFALTFNGQQTRPLGYEGRTSPPSAQAVEDALNDLPGMANLGAPTLCIGIRAGHQRRRHLHGDLCARKFSGSTSSEPQARRRLLAPSLCR